MFYCWWIHLFIVAFEFRLHFHHRWFFFFFLLLLHVAMYIQVFHLHFCILCLSELVVVQMKTNFYCKHSAKIDIHAVHENSLIKFWWQQCVVLGFFDYIYIVSILFHHIPLLMLKWFWIWLATWLAWWKTVGSRMKLTQKLTYRMWCDSHLLKGSTTLNLFVFVGGFVFVSLFLLLKCWHSFKRHAHIRQRLRLIDHFLHAFIAAAVAFVFFFFPCFSHYFAIYCLICVCVCVWLRQCSVAEQIK